MIKFKIKGLDELEKDFRNKFKSASVEWGYGPKSGNHPNGQAYADIAAANEYGAPENKMYNTGSGNPAPIPPRDFFHRTITEVDVMPSALEKLGVRKNEFRAERVLDFVVQSLQLKIKDIIDEGGFTDNTEATISKKGFNHPLVETGGLAKAAKVQREIKVYKV